MPGYFEPLPDGGAAVPLEEAEIGFLRGVAVQLLDLIGQAERPDGDVDALLASVFAEGPGKPPTDPVLARLFPDAYGDADDDAREASAEFRRYTEDDLRARKRDDVQALLRSLEDLHDDGRAVLRLRPEECRRWLGALNDIRLAIATRLELTEETDDRELLALPDADPRKPMLIAFSWLTGLQDSLVESLTA